MYDVLNDPNEIDRISSDRSAVSSILRSTNPYLLNRKRVMPAAGMNEQELENLKSLGYLQ